MLSQRGSDPLIGSEVPLKGKIGCIGLRCSDSLTSVTPSSEQFDCVFAL